MGFFIRFAEVLVRCLCFHFFTYVVHAVSENHFKLGTWAGYKKAMGLRPQTPMKIKKVTAQVVSCMRCAN